MDEAPPERAAPPGAESGMIEDAAGGRECDYMDAYAVGGVESWDDIGRARHFLKTMLPPNDATSPRVGRRRAPRFRRHPLLHLAVCAPRTRAA